MKRTERDAALKLRRQGKSLGEIAVALGVAKGSVSVWVRDVPLTPRQRGLLTARGFSVDAVEKRRTARIRNTKERHQVVIDRAKADISSLSRHELLLIGAALYWGEGSKKNRNMASIANSDPLLIRLMMRFFSEVCGVPKDKFRGHIHTYSHQNAKAAEEYWSMVSGISRSQFYKTYSKPSRVSLGKKDSLPFGTLQIYVCDTNIALIIRGWMEKLGEFAEVTSAT